VERGRATFLRTCSGCHGVGGTGGVPTPAFNQPATPPRNLTDPEFQASHTDEQLMFVVKNGKGNMPAFGVLLTDEQMREVVAFVRTLGKPKP
jgi:mono/diheme cytochrome c family protein